MSQLRSTMTRRAGWTARLITTLAVILALTAGASAQDNTPPGPASAEVYAESVLRLYTDEALDQTSLPDRSAFTVKIGSVALPAGLVGFCGQNCLTILTHLTQNVGPGDTVTVSYTKPARSGPVGVHRPATSIFVRGRLLRPDVGCTVVTQE